jgi:hypothetical protein
LRGKKGRDGKPIRLSGKRLPGCWVVEEGALEEFIAALTSDRVGTAGPAVPPDPCSHEAAERAGRELAKRGI